jgi:hypothetical protein
MRRSPISAPALAPVTNVNCGRVPRTLSSNVPKKQRSSCIRREAEITAEETTDPARLVFIDETSTNTAMVRLRGRCPRGIRLIDQCAARALEDDHLRRRPAPSPQLAGPLLVLPRDKYNAPSLQREDLGMISRHKALLNALVFSAVLGSCFPAFGELRRPSPIQMLDTDNDGTVDLAEAKKAASALFDKLDRDHDGTLDKRELRGRLNAKEFATADPDHDGTLTKVEYLAVVEQRFGAADPDSDGTLDVKELRTRAGRALLRLLQ